MVWLSLAAPGALGAQEAERPRPLDSGWEPLFNGKNLDGWTIFGTEKWSVDNGTILGETGPDNDDGFLKTIKTYKDFHAFLRFKCETDTNSGFFFHTFLEDDISKIKFIQVEIDNQFGDHTAGLHGDGVSWIVWPAPENEFVLKPFEWNDLMVKVEGKRIRTWLNGVAMIDFTYPRPGVSDGIIALQIHPGGNTRIRFKDLWIKDLSRR